MKEKLNLHPLSSAGSLQHKRKEADLIWDVVAAVAKQADNVFALSDCFMACDMENRLAKRRFCPLPTLPKPIRNFLIQIIIVICLMSYAPL